MAPIGFACWKEQGLLAFTDRDSGWVVNVDGPMAHEIESTIKFHLTGPRPPRLATRYLYNDILTLATEITAVVNDIAKVFVDGLEDLSYCTGRSIISRMARWSISDDALDALIISEQLRLEAPPFYAKIAVPLHRAEACYCGDPEEGVRFKVTYDNLLLRVIAHFTQDPFLIRLFTDPQYARLDPLTVLAETLDIQYTQVLPFIVNLMVGEDEAAMRRRFPVQAQYVPENYGVIKVLHADKKLPTMRYALSAALDEYRGRSAALSLYGRHAAWGTAPADAVIHHYFGSKQDVLDVALVSIENAGGFALRLTEDGWGRSVITGYTDANPGEFEPDMTDLVQLANPLIVPLNGRVFLDG